MLNLSNFSRQGRSPVASQVMGLVSLVATVLVGLPAEASVPLRRADVEALRNRVEFIRPGRNPRAARRSDVLAIGDALRTAAQAQADLRFNDGSLARVGERATFQFQPNTRNFRLTNGTLLLLIPPGQGRTNIQTPSAVTGIQGSAVVVRYIPESDLTMVMALTNNPAGPMTITANGCAEAGAACAPTEYSLYGGQMALIQNNQVQVVEFDLPMFYQTSPLVEGLELDNPDAESPLGAVLEQVRAETLEALDEQSPFSEDSLVLNPTAIGLDSADQGASEQPWMLSPSGNGVSPLSPLSGMLTPGNSLVTIPPQAGSQSTTVGNPTSGGNAGIAPSPVLTPTTPGTGANPNPTPNPGTGANPNPTPNPGAGANPNPIPNPGAGANPNPTPSPGAGTNPNPTPNPGAGANPNPTPNPGAGANPNPTPNPGAGANPNPTPNPGAGANPNPTPNPGAGANPNPTPNPGAGANPNPTPNPGAGANPNPTLNPGAGANPNPTPNPGSGITPAPPGPQPPAGGPGGGPPAGVPGGGPPAGGPGGGPPAGVPGNGPPAGGPGGGPPGGGGPGNAAPPPFSGGVPANPPAEPGPFFPPDK